MSEPESRWIPVDLNGRTFHALDLEHEDVGRRVLREIRSGVDVYYDRRWSLTGTFCRFLMERPELLEGRTVFVAGAGVGLEAVVAGTLAEAVVLNDLAPVALELAAEQLERNGVERFEIVPGPFQAADLSGVDLVMACFVVYDAGTRDAMAALLERAAGRSVPALLANEDLGRHFSRLLDEAEGPVTDLDPEGKGRIVRVG